MTIEFMFKPIEQWPGTLRRESQRKRAAFSATWSQRQTILRRELRHHMSDWAKVEIQIAIPPDQWRIDGTPRMKAQFDHPGVVLLFKSIHTGDMRFSCDTYTGPPTRDPWKDNLYAIALALEALRKIERYGVGSGHEQFAGFKALGSGIEMGPARPRFSFDEAVRFLAMSAGWLVGGGSIHSVEQLDAVYAKAAKLHHPDHGGDNDVMVKINAARDIILKGLS